MHPDASPRKSQEAIGPGGCLCGGGGGGALSLFSPYVGSDPASTVHPKKYQEFQAPQKIFEILATQNNIPPSLP